MSTKVPPILTFQVAPKDEYIAVPVPIEFLSPERLTVGTTAKIAGDKNKDKKDGSSTSGTTNTPASSSASSAKKENSNIQFEGITFDDFTTELFIDRTESPFPAIDNARTNVLLLRNTIMLPLIFGANATKAPPKIRYIWGSFVITGYCTKMVENYTYFSPAGIPLRAEVSITIKQIRNFIEEKLYGNEGASRKFWTVKSGDRLDLIANDMYSDSTLWRPIAEANAISRPSEFPRPEDIGRTLVIPDERIIARGV